MQVGVFVKRHSFRIKPQCLTIDVYDDMLEVVIEIVSKRDNFNHDILI